MTSPTFKKALAVALALITLILALVLRPGWEAVEGRRPEARVKVIGPLLKDTTVVYDFRSPVRNLAGLDLRWATYARVNRSKVDMVLTRLDTGREVDRRSFEAAEIEDWGFTRWRFGVLRDIYDVPLRLTVVSPDADPANCLALLGVDNAPDWAVSLTVAGDKTPGGLPLRVMAGAPVPIWSSPVAWLGLLIALLILFVIWPTRPLACSARALVSPPPPGRRAVLITALLLTLSVSVIIGWPNVAAWQRYNAIGWGYSPTFYPDENVYAELTHKLGRGTRIISGDLQAVEKADLLTPYVGALLPVGVMAVLDRILGPVGAAMVIDFILPAGMVLLMFLLAVRYGSSTGAAAVMALVLVSFNPRLVHDLTTVDWAGAWPVIGRYLAKPGTYFAKFVQPQMSGFIAVAACLALWSGYGRGGRRRLIIASLALGALFYSDAPFQHFIIGATGMLLPISLLRRDWPRLGRAATMLGGSLIVGLPYWINLWLFNRQEWAPAWMAEFVDSVEPLSFNLHDWELRTLALCGALALICLAVLIRRWLRPDSRLAADWRIDITFAPVWAFTVIFMADQVTGVDLEKYHYIWRGLGMWLPVAALGWLWWWLERRFTSARAGRVINTAALVFCLACLANMVSWADFGPHALTPPKNPAPSQVTAIRPGMLEVIDHLNAAAGPEDVVLTLDFAQMRQLGTHTDCFSYIPVSYVSMVMNRGKVERTAWAYALLDSKFPPRDYLEYHLFDPPLTDDAARNGYLQKTFEGIWRGNVWAPYGHTYRPEVRQMPRRITKRWKQLRARGVTPDQSPFRLDWVVIGPLERIMGAEPDPGWYEPVLLTKDTQLYRVRKERRENGQ